jgi:hypothetical protein
VHQVLADDILIPNVKEGASRRSEFRLEPTGQGPNASERRSLPRESLGEDAPRMGFDRMHELGPVGASDKLGDTAGLRTHRHPVERSRGFRFLHRRLIRALRKVPAFEGRS